MVARWVLVSLSVLVCCCVLASAAIDGDRITSLPGWSGALPTRHFAGYLDVANGRHLHYWFVESMRTPATDPVVIWFNGGPGCSSLDGFLYEMGPFHIVEPFPNTTTPSLYANPNTWVKESNMIYLEAPACVGLSYADTIEGCRNNDTQQAIDNLAALRKWYQGFPEYAKNPLYIAGESYAGVYVPTLALQILANGKDIPLKGIMVGNGVIGNANQDSNRLAADYLWGHGLVSETTYRLVYQACGMDMRQPSPACVKAFDQMAAEVDHVNIYNIYGECVNSGFPPEGTSMASRSSLGWRRPISEDEQAVKLLTKLRGPDACIDAGAATVYLNRPEVRTAIHAKSVSEIGQWAICTDKLQYSVIQPSLPPLYKEKLIPYIRVLIYNGEADACVPYNGNEMWTSGLGLPLAPNGSWRAWRVDDQVAGYVTSYTNDFSFVTIKGAGHMVPQTHPKWAYAMFSRFVNRQPF